jgi:hypothetical protein
MKNQFNTISLETAKQQAPAAFATSPAPHIRSKRYSFTPTHEIIDWMGSMGYGLTGAEQSGTKSDLWKNYGAHIVKFQKEDLFIKANDGTVEARPQIVLINSHDGSRPIQFEMGIFRLVCSNGLMVKSMDMGSFRERHTKYDYNTVKSMIEQKIEALPTTMGTINRWSQRDMNPKERFQFAMDALQLRLGQDRKAEEHEIRSILEPKRRADEGTSLWTTFNVVQEGLVRGGFQVGERRARAISNPWADLKINSSLWALANEYEQVA